jgi:hypothetical protein
VLPDALAGHRLAGTARDQECLRAALRDLGVNPLLIDAFRTRRQPNSPERRTGTTD